MGIINHAYKFFCILCLFVSPHFFLFEQALANNLSVSNVNIIEQNTAAQTARIYLELSWDNSWYNEVNYDAVWLFAKYSIDSGNTWHHAYLSTSSPDYTIDSGYEVKVGTSAVSGNTRGMGVFVQRNTPGFGSSLISEVTLKWNWGQNGLSATTSARVKVYAIEMVYVPAASFYIGDGSSPGAFCKLGSTTPALIGTSLTRDIIVEQGSEKFETMLGGWKEFGSPIYGIGRWSEVEHGYFGRTKSPYFLFGDNAPSQEWMLYTQAPLE